MLSAMNGEKFQRITRYQKKQSKKRKHTNRLTKHHNKAKSLGGTYANWNIFMLSSEHHQAYHKLFGLMTFDQAAEVLLRMQEIHKQSL